MNRQLSFFWQLGILTAILVLAGIALFSIMEGMLSPGHFVALLLSISVINAVTWWLVNRGIERSEEGGVVFVLAGIGTNFLLYLLLILVVWLVNKNLAKPFVLVFFALYLIFTFFLGINLFKSLKNN